MQIHVVHSNDFDFKKELYMPLRHSVLNTEHDIFLPHETGEFINTEQLIKNADVVIAEVSYPSTGLGIELGWAKAYGTPVICFFKAGSRVSSSLKGVSEDFIEYESGADLISKLSESIKNISS